MENIVKKVVIFSMIGVMQIGLGTSVLEASPQYNEPFPQQQDNRYDRHRDQDQDRHERERYERQRHERERIENERHEREMQRRHHENEREWHERQRHERERHDNANREIVAGIIGIIIGSQIN